MAIHDRDYYREEGNGFLDAVGRQTATVWLLTVTVVVFVVQYLTGGRDRDGVWDPTLSPLCSLGEYNYRRIMAGELWRLLTPIFLHAGLLHLAFNMLVLYFTGTQIEERYGRREFVLFYLLTGFLANVGYLLVHVLIQPPQALAVGASGAVLAVLVLYACNWPRQPVYLYFVLRMPVWVLVVGIVILNALGAAASGLGATDSRVAFVVHLWGALFGALYFKWGGRITDLLPSRSRRQEQAAPRPRLRVVSPEPDELDEEDPVPASVEAQPRPAQAADEHFEARVDAVLEKVSKHGQESLTPEERQLLFQASERYKRRRR